MSEYNTSADQEFRALIRHMYNYLRACYHLSFTDVASDKKPRSLLRTTSILENQIKPAIPSKSTNDLIKGNAQNWLGISMEILQNHYLDVQENSQIYILTASLNRWEEAWAVAEKWIKKRYRTIEQSTLTEAATHITEIITHQLNTSMGTPSARGSLTTSAHPKTGTPAPSMKDGANTDPLEGTSHLCNTTNTHRSTVPPLPNKLQASPTTSGTTTPPPDNLASLQSLEPTSTIPFALGGQPLTPRARKQLLPSLTPRVKITLASPISKHTTIFQLTDTPTPPATLVPDTQSPPENKFDPPKIDSPPLTLGSDFTPLTPLAKTSTPLTGGTEQTSPLDLSKDSPILTTAAGTPFNTPRKATRKSKHYRSSPSYVESPPPNPRKKRLCYENLFDVSSHNNTQVTLPSVTVHAGNTHGPSPQRSAELSLQTETERDARTPHTKHDPVSNTYADRTRNHSPQQSTEPDFQTEAESDSHALYIRHDPRGDKYANWSLSPSRPIQILGDSNISRLPPFNDARIQVDAYHGAKLAHATNILSNHTPISPQVSQVILAFGLNNREDTNHSRLQAQVSALVRKARRTFPNARLHIPLVNYNRSLPVSQIQNIKHLNGSIFATGLSIPMLSLFKFHTQPDLIHWTPATGLEMSLHWKYTLN